MKERGNVYVILALVIVASLAVLALFKFVDAHWETTAGVTRGAADKQREWDDANRIAQEKEDRDRKAREAEGRAQAQALLDANKRADANDIKWRQARAANRKPLGTLECPPNPQGPGGVQPVLADSAPDGSAGVRLRLSGDFLRLYDAAWTGQDGQPVFPDPGGTAEEAGSALGLDAILDIHQINAASCSKDRRQMNKLIDLIIKLRGSG